MKSIALRQVHHGGITIQVPEIWDVETETYQEENGDKSYEIDINAQGNDVRSINISFGPMPEGSDAERLQQMAETVFSPAQGEVG